MRNWLRVGDKVRIDDALAFPLSYGKTGVVTRNRNTGLYDVQLGNWNTVLVYRNEVEIIEEVKVAQ